MELRRKRRRRRWIKKKNRMLQKKRVVGWNFKIILDGRIEKEEMERCTLWYYVSMLVELFKMLIGNVEYLWLFNICKCSKFVTVQYLKMFHNCIDVSIFNILFIFNICWFAHNILFLDNSYLMINKCSDRSMKV